MPELKRQFGQGKMNKDLDERLVPDGEYRDALNIQVATSEGSDAGAIENILGNKLPYSASISSNIGTNPKCIGSIRHDKTECIYWFVAADNKACVIEYDQKTNIVTPVLVDGPYSTVGDSELYFDKDYLITGIDIVDDLLFWTDNFSEPKKINISKFKTLTNNTWTTTQIDGNDFQEHHITLIKKAPLKPPVLTMDKSARGGIVETTLSQTNFTYADAGGDIVPLPTGQITDGAGNVVQSSQLTFNTDLNGEINDKLKLTKLDGTDNENEVRLVITNTYSSNPRKYEVSIDSISEDISTGSQDWKVEIVLPKPMFEMKFPKFAYRYKYADGEYSTIGPWSEVAFLPDDFDYESKKGWNLGMKNNLRSLKIGGFTENVPWDVEEIDILYKDSVATNVMVVKSVKTTDDEYTAGTNGEIEVKSDTIYKTLPSNQMIRVFDNVPKKAKALTLSGNRVVMGNYVENFNLKDANGNDLSVKFKVAIVNKENETIIPKQPKPSIKSLRDYQVGVVYRDAYGRETPVFTDTSGAINLPKSSSINYNVIKVQILSDIPSWATHYKIFIKEASQPYYNMAMDKHYNAEDGNVWIAFPSSERNKVDDETFIVLKKEHDGDTDMKDDEARYKIIAIENEAPDFLKMSRDHKGTIEKENVGTPNNSIFQTATGFPDADSSYFDIHEDAWFPVMGGDPDTASSIKPVHEYSDLVVRLHTSSQTTKWYDVDSIQYKAEDNYWRVNIETKFEGSEVDFIGTSGSPTSGVMASIAQKNIKTKPEFQGRFFAKIAKDAVLEKAILAKANVEDYRVKASRKPWVAPIVGKSKDYWEGQNKGNDGRKAGWHFSRNTAYHWLTDAGGSYDTTGTGGGKYRGTYATEAQAKAGDGKGCKVGEDVIEIAYHWWGGTDGESRWGYWDTFETTRKPLEADFVKALEADGGLFRFKDDPNNAENIYKIVAHRRTHIICYDTNSPEGKWGSSRYIMWTLKLDKPIAWAPEDQGSTFTSNHAGAEMEMLQVYEDDEGSYSKNPAVWETEPKDLGVDIDIYYEASEAYPAANHGTDQTLSYSNCFSFGNGVESDRIRDDFNAPTIGKGIKASMVFPDQYKEEHKSNMMIFSGIYNSTSGTNNSNQFIQGEDITKSINKSYGSIQLMKFRRGDLDVLCEDKCFSVQADKDALFNADGSKNVVASSKVLGQAIPYAGEFGISTNPESYIQYGYRAYFADKNRGVVLRLSADGLEPISRYGMEDYFNDKLALDTKHIIGSFDEKNKEYNLTFDTKLASERDTVTWKESAKGWVTRKSFLQENGLTLNNTYYTFHSGELWSHNNEVRNTFYNTSYRYKADSTSNFEGSRVKFLFNDAPGTVKSFKTLNYEGTQSKIDADTSDSDLKIFNRVEKKGWYANSLATDLQEGEVPYFVDKENKWFNFIRGTETTLSNIDPKEFSFQGIGTATITAAAPDQVQITITENAD